MRRYNGQLECAHCCLRAQLAMRVAEERRENFFPLYPFLLDNTLTHTLLRIVYVYVKRRNFSKAAGKGALWRPRTLKYTHIMGVGVGSSQIKASCKRLAYTGVSPVRGKNMTVKAVRFKGETSRKKDKTDRRGRKMKRENVSGGANNRKFKIRIVTVSTSYRPHNFIFCRTAFTSISVIRNFFFALKIFPLLCCSLFARFTFNFSLGKGRWENCCKP